MARRGGGIVHIAERTEKLSSFSAAAVRTVRAIDGIVVSKPTPKKTTSLDGFERTRARDSSGE